MKKTMIILTLVCLILSLAACEAKDPENVFEMPQTESVETTAVETPATEAPGTALEFDSPGDFQHRNLMQVDSFVRYGDEILFTHLKNGQWYVYSMDMTTGEVSTFCKDATCYHVSPKCPTAGVNFDLEVYDGTLYGSKLLIDFNEPGWKTNIMGLKDGYFEKVVDGAVRQFWHANGDLYAVTSDNSVVVFRDGKGDPEILIEEYACDCSVMVGQYLYGWSWSPAGIMRFDLAQADPQGELIVPDACMPLPDRKHIYYLDKDYFLYRCNLDGSGAERLLDHPILLASMNYDEEYFYFRLYKDLYPDDAYAYLVGPESYDIYRMSKEDPAQVEKIAALPEPAYEIYVVSGYDKMIVSNVTGQDEESVYYLVAKDGSSVEKLELPDF